MQSSVMLSSVVLSMYSMQDGGAINLPWEASHAGSAILQVAPAMASESTSERPPLSAATGAAPRRARW